MTKLLKILGNVLHIVVEFLVILIILLLFFIRFSFFQTFLAKQATNYLSEKLDVKTSINKVDIAFFDRIYFDGVYLEDLKGDTLFYAGELYVNYNLSKIGWPRLNIDKVKLSNARANLMIYKNSEQLNLQFLVDAFHSDQPSKPNFAISVGEVELDNTHFSFNNANKPNIPFGVDYNHIDVKHIHLLANDISLTPDIYVANFEAFLFQEKSGFVLSNMKGKAQFGQNGLAMQNLEIQTPHSQLHLPIFKLKTDSLSDFSSFVDKVQLVSKILPSQASFKDIVYFAPMLKGMEDNVIISGETGQSIQQFQLRNIVLKYGEGSVIKGDFSLPDFRVLSAENIHQSIRYVHILPEDLNHFSFPSEGRTSHIEWPKALKGMTFLTGEKIRLNGKLNNLTVQADKVSSNIGTVVFHKPFKFSADTTFSRIKLDPIGGINSITLVNFNLNSVIKTDKIGPLNGDLTFQSLVMQQGNIAVNNVKGLLKNLSIYGYSYDYVNLQNINYSINNSMKTVENKIDGSFFIRDENLDMSFKGTAKIGRRFQLNSQINLECANLGALHPSLKERGELVTQLYVKADGTDFSHFKGNLAVDSVFYLENGKTFTTSDFNGFIAKKGTNDSLWVQSKLMDASVYGNINFSTITNDIIAQVTDLFTKSDKDIATRSKKINSGFFHYNIKVKSINQLLAIFLPELKIANQTGINGAYSGKDKNIQLQLVSDYVKYDSMRFQHISMNNQVSNGELLGLLNIGNVQLNDSLNIHNVHFTGLASDATLDAQLLFKDTKGNPSNLQWLTHFVGDSIIKLSFLHSFLSLKGKKWNLKDHATITYENKIVTVKGFELENENQYIAANGTLSDSTKDKLYIDLMGFDLHEIGILFGSKKNLSGIANVTGYITSPFSNFQFFGESIIRNLKVNKSSVGNVSFGMHYGSNGEKMNMYGDIYYRKEHTFHFDGYYLTKDKNNPNRLNFNMNFNATNIAVVNEFMDPDVIRDFKGKLIGKIKLTGTIEKPVVNGVLDVKDGMVNLAILGADFYYGGKLLFNKDGIYIQQMPITDEKGNVGYITGQLTHDYFKDIKFEIAVNMGMNPMDGFPGYVPVVAGSNRFLVMHTKYAIDKAYYGDAYMSGVAKISGTTDNLKIVVNATTEKGTKLYIPMYGPTTIEDEGFITFKKVNDSTGSNKKIDLTGVDLRLHFNVTDDAEVQLIFDKSTGDAIAARGSGNIGLSVNQLNQLEMDGTYTVKDGLYNFSMGPYKQQFIIRPGGTVQWSGSPYDAILDLQAYYKTRANLAVVMPDVIDNSTSTNQEIYANMKITGALTEPTIEYDLRAPQASESGKAILARIRSEQDELNRQFFSILITKSFLPLSGRVGTGGGSTNALLDLASSQINAILNKVTEGYQMNVNLDNDQYSGEFSGEVGISKSFLDNRLIVSGSFGIGSVKDKTVTNTSVNQNRFIGDVKLEYLLNKSGTFRLNVFNKSNDYSVLQNEGRGQFTQGIGISYKENFYSIRDFQLIQSLINLFRKKENDVHVDKNGNQKVSIPTSYRSSDTIKE